MYFGVIKAMNFRQVRDKSFGLVGSVRLQT